MQIDAALLPIVAGKLKTLIAEDIWIDTDNWRQGYNAIAEMLLMQNGIVESIDRLYRLIDTSINGAQYIAIGDPAVVYPDIPAAPSNDLGGGAGLRPELLALRGTLPAGWFGWGSQPATLADIARAMRSDTPAQVDRAKAALTALQVAAQGATIFDVVRGFLEDSASVTAEGGILIVDLIALMSNAAMMGLQAGQLDSLLAKMDRLIASLDGGATPAPTTNVIAELQSTNTKLV
jgi:hypothetical protein